MPSVKIKNIGRRRADVMLDHPALLSKRYGAQRIEVNEVVHDPRTGDMVTRPTRKSAPGTLTILAGTTTGPLPAVVRGLPDVTAGVAAGTLVVEDVKEKSAAKPAAETSTTPKSTTPRGRRREGKE